jgi:hypothetical protein
VVIGSQQQVPMAGLLTVNAIYNYTPSEAPSGEGGSIPFANQGDRTLTLASLNASQIRTLTRTATLDMNYGLTERFGIQVSLPYKQINSDAQIGGLNPVPYSDKGLGDIRIAVKYNVLPTLRSMIVVGIGTDLPTGDYGQRVQGGSLAESTLQIGRGMLVWCRLCIRAMNSFLTVSISLPWPATATHSKTATGINLGTR